MLSLAVGVHDTVTPQACLGCGDGSHAVLYLQCQLLIKYFCFLYAAFFLDVTVSPLAMCLTYVEVTIVCVLLLASVILLPEINRSSTKPCALHLIGICQDRR